MFKHVKKHLWKDPRCISWKIAHGARFEQLRRPDAVPPFVARSGTLNWPPERIRKEVQAGI
jgi:hypothetical protein